eukprot:366372-Chlamydomonas_euryale.AAC.16
MPRHAATRRAELGGSPPLSPAVLPPSAARQSRRRHGRRRARAGVISIAWASRSQTPTAVAPLVACESVAVTPKPQTLRAGRTCSVSSVVRKIRYRQRRHSGLLPRRVLRDRRATAAWQTPAAVRTIAKLRYTTRPLQSFPKFQCSDRWASRAQMHAPSLWVSRWSVARP